MLRLARQIYEGAVLETSSRLVVVSVRQGRCCARGHWGRAREITVKWPSDLGCVKWSRFSRREGRTFRGSYAITAWCTHQHSHRSASDGWDGGASADCYRTGTHTHTPGPASSVPSAPRSVKCHHCCRFHRRPTARVFTPPSQTQRLCDSTELSLLCVFHAPACVFIHASARVCVVCVQNGCP